MKPPNYDYGKHYPNEIKEKSVKEEGEDTPRKARSYFLDLLHIPIPYGTIRNNISDVPFKKMDSSGHFVYDEQ